MNVCMCVCILRISAWESCPGPVYNTILCFIVQMFQCVKHFCKGQICKFARSKETLEAEKAALDKRVRELTFRLDMRVEDIPALRGDPLKAANSVSCTVPFLEELQTLLSY